MTEQQGNVLTGLTGSSPLGALAAFGLLRLCSQTDGFGDIRMAWTQRDDWVPVLHGLESADSDQMTSMVVDAFKKADTNYYNWSDDIRVKPEDFRASLLTHAEASTPDNRGLADFFTSFGSDGAIDRSKGLVKPTALYMTSAQQKFFKIIREHYENLSKQTESKFKTALFGPWGYEDSTHHLGWDPNMERLYSLRHKKPGEEKPQSVSAAVWLATQAMPLFPTAVHGTRLRTTAFVNTKREGNSFYWPVWRPPIGLDSLKSLLQLDALTNGKEQAVLVARGVEAVYRAQRDEFGQGYAVFRPGTPVFSVS